MNQRLLQSRSSPPSPRRLAFRGCWRGRRAPRWDSWKKDLGWQPHTVRAAISGLRKGGAEVTSTGDGKVPAYRIVSVSRSRSFGMNTEPRFLSVLDLPSDLATLLQLWEAAFGSPPEHLVVAGVHAEGAELASPMRHGGRLSAAAPQAPDLDRLRPREQGDAGRLAGARQPAGARMERPRLPCRGAGGRLPLRRPDLGVAVGDRTADHRHRVVRTPLLRAHHVGAELDAEDPLRHLHPEVLRGRARAGVQLAACPTRGLCCLRPSQGRGLDAGYPNGTTTVGSRVGRSNGRHCNAAGSDHVGRVDRVVLYKIDRLTRSLADFAKLVERLDRAGASFVSVTQSFNTATSMGRLTLNVLLSFAQFEREVTAERIRDKIAASKKKGLWMGGNVPLGYAADGRTLKINEEEARIVRLIYDLYLQRGPVRAVKQELDQRGLEDARNEQQAPRQADQAALPFGIGHLHYILSNPVYAGRIRHRAQIHDGQHPAIIDPAIWDDTQDRLAAGAARSREGSGSRDRRHAVTSPLAGKLFDETGDRLTPSHAKASSGKRHRYYVSNRLIRNSGEQDLSGWRLPATELEDLIARQVLRRARRSGLADAARECGRWNILTDLASRPKHRGSCRARPAPRTGWWPRKCPPGHLGGVECHLGHSGDRYQGHPAHGW